MRTRSSRGAWITAQGSGTATYAIDRHARVGNLSYLLSLGYEHHDARLPRLGRSPAATLTSGNQFRDMVSGSPRLRCLALSRRVPFTNWFTEPVFGLRVPVLRTGRAIRCEDNQPCRHKGGWQQCQTSIAP